MDTAPSTDKIFSRRDGVIGHMIFNNPERHNAVTLDMWDAVEKILTDFEADQDIRVLVLSGAGGKSFVSGADIFKFERNAARRRPSPITMNASSASMTAFYDFLNRPSP